MTTIKKCPCCGTMKTVEMQHQWDKQGSRMELSFIQRMDSTNIDGGKLESLVPRGSPDGQVLVVEASWIDDTAVQFSIFRRPPSAPTTPAPSPDMPIVPAMSRPDMETKAVEIGLKFKGMSDMQLAHALAEKLKVKEKSP